MLRILLIILVALAVIIGLMRLTGAKPGDSAPAAAAVEEPDVEALEPAADAVIDEPAVDTLDAPAPDGGETTSEVIEPAIEAVDGATVEAPAALDDASADAVPPAPDNTAPATDEPAPVAEPTEPGR